MKTYKDRRRCTGPDKAALKLKARQASHEADLRNSGLPDKTRGSLQGNAPGSLKKVC